MLMMNDQDYEALEALLSRKDYGGLRRALGKAEREALAEVWPRFRPLERLVLFKLMDAPAALEFYRELPFKGVRFEEEKFIYDSPRLSTGEVACLSCPLRDACCRRFPSWSGSRRF